MIASSAKRQVSQLVEALTLHSIYFVFVFMTMLPVLAVASGIPFASAQSVADLGQFTGSAVAGDLDQDGDLDVVVPNYGEGYCNWYENANGDASSWTQHTVVESSGGVEEVALGDLDADGDLDIAVHTEDTVEYYENRIDEGHAWVGHPVKSQLSFVASIAVADIDNDGDVDLYGHTHGANGSVFWIHNSNHDGSSWIKYNISTGILFPAQPLCADVDGDGVLDMIVGKWSNDSDPLVWWEHGMSAEHTWTKRTISVDSPLLSICAGDIDGDGDTDICTGNAAGGGVVIHKNDGTPAVGYWPTDTFPTDFDKVYFLKILDLDRDGDLDLAAFDNVRDYASFCENRWGNASTFLLHDIPSAGGEQSIEFVDLDNDGDHDILSGSFNENESAQWYENRSIHRTAVFGNTSTVSSSTSGPMGVCADDFNQDGNPDIAVAFADAEQVAVFNGDDSDPPSFTQNPVQDQLSGVSTVFPCDIDEDGDQDLLIPVSDDHEVSWCRNLRSTSSWGLSQVAQEAYKVSDAISVDFEKNGNPDVVFGQAISPSNTGYYIHWSRNKGTPIVGLTNWQQKTVTAAGLGGPVRLAAGDLRGSGRPDVVAAYESAGEVYLYTCSDSAPPTFSSTHVRAVSGANSVALADMDLDGDLDIVVAARKFRIPSFSGQIVWLENGANDYDGWLEHDIDTAAPWASDIHAADIDLDGDLDIISNYSGSSQGSSSGVKWYAHNGSSTPTFEELSIYYLRKPGLFPPRMNRLYPYDLDKDGDLDIVHTRDDDFVRWSRNNGGQFSLSTVKTAPAQFAPGSTNDLFKVTFTHRGIEEDLNAVLSRVGLKFLNSEDEGLNLIIAILCIDAIGVYADNGSGVFEPGTDVLIYEDDEPDLQTFGNVRIDLPDSSPIMRAEPGDPSTFFITLTLHPDTSQYLDAFKVTHLTEPSPTYQTKAIHQGYPGTGLLMQYAGNITTSLITVSTTQDTWVIN